MSDTKQTVRITVLGPKEAGKTALVFRYMARLFVGVSTSENKINQIRSNTSSSSPAGLDNLYHHCVCLDNILYDLEILDLADSKNGPKFERRSDAFIVVYSVASSSDFNIAKQLCESLQATYPRKPVLLIGNKMDLPRQVLTNEGQQVGGALFAEVSAAHIGSWEVHQAMYRLLRRVSEVTVDPALNTTKCHFVAQSKPFGRRDSMDTSSA
ncbi:ras-related and estrogen-regulated growth inhibitor protein-like [Tropilaelaps mercedesae]|uniref:small monomeric GTPase n=1 Tax=Tropilaelaps mercedesae TaxID=418985 RepID=A0A1V9X2H8_9ACAR|nr:ras-related and estrogen-regulated growth inhibitor protein-like [Tropilaelaps mercedesae]